MANNPHKSHVPHVNEGFKKSIKNFDLREIIGAGTFSEVYRAYNRETKEILALKCFRQEIRTMVHYEFAAAAKEIAIMKILTHPNIITLKIYEISRTHVYIGTEYAAFGNLQDFLKDFKNISETIVKRIMIQLMSGLDYMHTLGIFHGDLKPHNVICTSMKPDGPEIKICDFGLSEIKLKGQILNYKCGSLLYMAPEVVLRHPVDVTCDLWSAGVIMYNAIFNRTLFNVTEKEKEKWCSLLNRRTLPDFQGSERYSKKCIDFLKGLLTYDKSLRTQGDALRKHPFMNIEPQFVLQYENYFFTRAKGHADSGFQHSKNNKFGEALVDAMQTVIELKIQYNLSETESDRMFLRKKWIDYEKFISYLERTLLTLPSFELNPTEVISDEAFRKHLTSTPRLADGFDIGCAAEMFLKEGNKEKALDMFHQALQAILPIMKKEPKSNRKEILGRRCKQWIEYVEKLTGEHDINDINFTMSSSTTS
ncbi:calcium/calmodulin-dependent protein kinase type 1B-like [Euwallacea similis]|uniref:calcium/calmodulin-dependent protein kinase type 1B-like n=1 Tax=Euwallacea similis TaxID=1736056 RepID=UPI00344B53BC